MPHVVMNEKMFVFAMLQPFLGTTLKPYIDYQKDMQYYSKLRGQYYKRGSVFGCKRIMKGWGFLLVLQYTHSKQRR